MYMPHGNCKKKTSTDFYIKEHLIKAHDKEIKHTDTKIHQNMKKR